MLIATALVVVAVPTTSQAAPGGPARAEAARTPGDDHLDKTTDNRRGRLAPTERQRSLAASAGAKARWNTFGTPATLTPAALTPSALTTSTPAAKPLAAGL